MSQENVDLAQRMNTMVLAGDIDAALEFVADDVVVTDLNAPIDETRVFRGRAALGARLAGYRELVDDFRREVEEWLDAGDWVITIGHWRGRAKASGVEIEGRGANAARWQDGKIVEWIMNFPTKQATLEAVGLSE